MNSTVGSRLAAMPMSRNRGFTFIELVTALTITGVLLALAIPSFREILLNSRRTSVINELITSFQMARTESLKLNRTVTVCAWDVNATTPVTPTTGSCSSTATNWGKGWLVYDNVDGLTAGGEPDAGETILRAVINPAPGIGVGSGGVTTGFSFRPFGVNSVNGTLTICDVRGAATATERRAIIISGTGRPRISKVTSGGGSLTCP